MKLRLSSTASICAKVRQDRLARGDRHLVGELEIAAASRGSWRTASGWQRRDGSRQDARARHRRSARPSMRRRCRAARATPRCRRWSRPSGRVRKSGALRLRAVDLHEARLVRERSRNPQRQVRSTAPPSAPAASLSSTHAGRGAVAPPAAGSASTRSPNVHCPARARGVVACLSRPLSSSVEHERGEVARIDELDRPRRRLRHDRRRRARSPSSCGCTKRATQ